MVHRKWEEDQDFYYRLGKKFREIREKKRISASEVALAIGVAFQQVQKYESGKNRFPLSKLISGLNYMDIPVSSFLGSIGISGDGGDAIIPLSQDEFITLAGNLSQVHESVNAILPIIDRHKTMA